MKNKISMSTLRGYTVEDSVKFAVECGFDGIEIQTDYLCDKKEIRYATDRGLDVSLHAPCGDINISALNKGICRESVAQVKQAIDLAKEFNLRVVTFHPGRLSSARENKDEKLKLMAESVAEIADYAKEKQVYVAIENMESRGKELVLTAEALNRYEKIADGNPFFGVTLDFSHFATNKIYPDDIGEIKLPVYNVHLSQCVDGRPHYPTYESGEIELCKVDVCLGRIGYTSNVVLELKSVFDADVYKKSLSVLKNER